MHSAPKIHNESERIEELKSFSILDTPPEKDFDEIVQFAADHFEVPIALLTLVDENRQWFKSKVGLDVGETPRDISFCGHAIAKREVFIVNDASQDPRFCDNPLVTGAPHIRFYAGMPLYTNEDVGVGTLCIIDKKAREFSEKDQATLAFLAKQMTSLLLKRRRSDVHAQDLQFFNDVQVMTKSGGWDIDLDTGETQWTQGIYDIYALEKGASTNVEQGLASYDPEDQKKLEAYIERCAKHKVPFDDIFSFTDNNGNNKWVRSIGRPVISDNNEVKKIIGTFQDVTRETQAFRDLKSLSEQNQIYRLWVENTCEGIWEIDLQGNTTHVNNGLALMLGYFPKEMIGKSFLDFMDEKDRASALEKLSERSAGISETHLWKMRSKTGSAVWINMSTYPMRDDKDAVHGVVAMCTDVSKLKENQDNLELILANISEGYFDWHVQKDYEYMSPRFWQILGYDPDSKKHHPSEWQKLVHPEDLERVLKEFDLHVQSKGKHPFSNEVRYLHADGKYRWIRCEGKVIEWAASGAALRMVGTHRDIHAEKELAEKIRRLNQTHRLAVENTGIGVWSWNLKNNSVDYSPEWAKIRGLNREELKFDLEDWSSRVHPEDLAKAYAEIERYRNGETEAFSCVHRVRHSKGHWVYVHGSGRYVEWDELGNPLLFVGTDIDVTDLVEARKKSEQAKKQLDLILEMSGVDIVEFDMKKQALRLSSSGLLSQVCPSFEKNIFLDYKAWMEKIIPEDAKEFEAMLMSIKDGKSSSGQKTFCFLTGDEKKYILFSWNHKVGGDVITSSLSFVCVDVTSLQSLSQERDALSQKYKSVAERLDSVISQAPLVIYECDNDENWSMNFISPYVEKLTGYRPDEVLDNKKISFANIIHPDDQDKVNTEVEKSISLGEKYHIEYRLRHKEGGLRWVWEKGYRNSQGALTGVIVDVTQKKKAELELERIVNEQSNFFNLGVNYLAIASFEGYLQTINPYWRNLGYAQSHLLSTPISQIIHPDDCQDFEQQMLALSRQKIKVVDILVRFQKSDGSYIHLRWRASSDVGSHLIYIVATDSTKELRESNLRKLINDISNQFIVSKANSKDFLKQAGNILSDFFAIECHLFHKQFDGKINDSFDSSSHQEANKSLVKSLEALASSLPPDSLGISLMSTQVSAEVHELCEKMDFDRQSFLFPIRYNERLKGGLLILGQSEQIRSENLSSLRHILDTLGQLFHDLDGDQELDYQKRISMHSAKLASIGEMAADVGHEINNPLAIISGQSDAIYSHISRENHIDPNLEKRFSSLKKSIKRIQNIVSGMRGLARSDSFDQGTFNLSLLIHETCDMLAEMYSQEGVKMDLDVESDISLLGHRGRFQQALVNILNNAKDAVENSEKKQIHIKAETSENGVLVSISDTGKGMDAEVQEKVFEPFFTTKDVNKGTGIGMALVHSIVQEFDGDIDFESQPDQGTTFHLRIPTHRIIKSHIEITEGVEQKKTDEEIVSPYITEVLVVDDEQDILDIFTDYLADSHVIVHQALGAEEAMKIFSHKGEAIDVVFSDIKMPGRSGLDLFHDLKKKNYRGAFYFMSGGVKLDFNQYKDQADGFLSKPFLAKDIDECLQALRSRKKAV